MYRHQREASLTPCVSSNQANAILHRFYLIGFLVGDSVTSRTFIKRSRLIVQSFRHSNAYQSRVLHRFWITISPRFDKISKPRSRFHALTDLGVFMTEGLEI